MSGYSCLVRNPFSWLAALGSLLAFTLSPSFGFRTIFLTSSAVVLCPVIICRFWRCEQKLTSTEESPSLSTEVVFSESDFQDNISSLKKSLEKKVLLSEVLPVSPKSETQHQSIEKYTIQAEEEVSEIRKHQKEEKTVRGYLLRSSEALLSDSESHDQTTSSDDYSENDSSFRENLSHGTNFSDGSISDEESLIEIELPTGHYVDPKRSQEQSWYGFQQKWPDCSLESRFRQQNWMDMLSEMNEENFIEFDICKGSIKCSRFEIEA